VKNLFLALLLGNLLFFGWRLWIAPPEVPADQILTRGPEPDIALARPPAASVSAASGATPLPANTAPPPSVAVNSTAPASPPPDGSAAAECLRVGPIADVQLVETLRSSLASRGLAVTTVTEEGQIWVGHWVQLESVPTRAEADAITARLAAGGLPDAYVLQTSPPFAISLGVFRDKARAEKVAADATRLGFRPQTTDRFRTGVHHWLHLVNPPGSTFSVEALGRETGQILRAEPASCRKESIDAAPVQ
jgi:hypothetical protein